MNRFLALLFVVALTMLSPLVASAQDSGGGDSGGGTEGEAGGKNIGCPDSGAITNGGFASDMCWSCMLPIRIAGAGASGKKFPGDMASPVCVCPSKLLYNYPTPGATYGMWKPTHFTESVRKPGCFPAIGQKANMGKIIGLGQGGKGQKPGVSGFFNSHMYVFPTGAILDMFTSMACSEDSYDMDLLMVTEIDPTYSNGELSMVINPEAYLFNNPIAMATCMVDAVASSAYRPIKELFWCFGSWGQTYPLTGHGNAKSGVQDASLASSRLVAMMHKRGLMKRTYGSDSVCAASFAPFYEKQQYRWQMLYPMPQRFKNDWTGAATILSREHRHAPVVGDDWVQIQWRYEECCVNIP